MRGVDMALACTLFALLVAVPVSAVSPSFLQVGTESHATAWLKAHGGNPNSDQLESLKESDPNSYALVQNMLSSPDVVFSLMHSEARAMDAPAKRITTPQSSVFAGLQVPAERREGLVELPEFARTVETAAGIAEDNSKLAHDFGDEAAAPQTGTALNQQQTASTKPGNPLVEAAAQYTQNDVAEVIATSPHAFAQEPAKTSGNSYTKWLN